MSCRGKVAIYPRVTESERVRLRIMAIQAGASVSGLVRPILAAEFRECARELAERAGFEVRPRRPALAEVPRAV